MARKTVNPAEIEARFEVAEKRLEQIALDPLEAENIKLHRALEYAKEVSEYLGADYEVSARPAKRGVEFIVRPLKRP